jgi:hypothetical protein
VLLQLLAALQEHVQQPWCWLGLHRELQQQLLDFLHLPAVLHHLRDIGIDQFWCSSSST